MDEIFDPYTEIYILSNHKSNTINTSDHKNKNPTKHDTKSNINSISICENKNNSDRLRNNNDTSTSDTDKYRNFTNDDDDRSENESESDDEEEEEEKNMIKLKDKWKKVEKENFYISQVIHRYKNISDYMKMESVDKKNIIFENDNSVYVGGFGRHVEKSDIYRFFRECGEIYSFRGIFTKRKDGDYNNNDDDNDMFCFIKFVDELSCDRALMKDNEILVVERVKEIVDTETGEIEKKEFEYCYKIHVDMSRRRDLNFDVPIAVFKCYTCLKIMFKYINEFDYKEQLRIICYNCFCSEQKKTKYEERKVNYMHIDYVINFSKLYGENSIFHDEDGLKSIEQLLFKENEMRIGLYNCRFCGKEWKSNLAYERTYQKCDKCDKENFAKTLRLHGLPLRRDEFAGVHHSSECQDCILIGNCQLLRTQQTFGYKPIMNISKIKVERGTTMKAKYTFIDLLKMEKERKTIKLLVVFEKMRNENCEQLIGLFKNKLKKEAKKIHIDFKLVHVEEFMFGTRNRKIHDQIYQNIDAKIESKISKIEINTLLIITMGQNYHMESFFKKYYENNIISFTMLDRRILNNEKLFIGIVAKFPKQEKDYAIPKKESKNDEEEKKEDRKVKEKYVQKVKWFDVPNRTLSSIIKKRFKKESEIFLKNEMRKQKYRNYFERLKKNDYKIYIKDKKDSLDVISFNLLLNFYRKNLLRIKRMKIITEMENRNINDKNSFTFKLEKYEDLSDDDDDYAY